MVSQADIIEVWVRDLLKEMPVEIEVEGDWAEPRVINIRVGEKIPVMIFVDEVEGIDISLVDKYRGANTPSVGRTLALDINDPEQLKEAEQAILDQVEKYL